MTDSGLDECPSIGVEANRKRAIAQRPTVNGVTMPCPRWGIPS